MERWKEATGSLSSQVISFVADDNYLDHARSVLVNCRRQGEWTGDFCMISPAGCNSDFESRGIHVLRVPDQTWDFMVKFNIFTPYFHQWDQAFCIDLDIMVQGPLQKIFDGLTPRLPKILCTLEDGPILGGLKHWDKAAGEGPDTHPEVYEEIERRFPHVTQRMFNMAFIFYSPASMPSETIADLRALHEEFQKANPSNADQMLVNLLLYDRLEEAGKDYFCFFGCDEPSNRVRSDYRGWRGDEFPALVHFTRWHSQWIEKPLLDPPMGGYYNERLSRISHELYLENLAAFNAEFPIL